MAETGSLATPISSASNNSILKQDINVNAADKVGKLLHTTIEAVNAKSGTELADNMVRRGMKPETARKLSSVIMEAINAREMTDAQADILVSLAKDERVTAAMEDTFGNKDSAANLRQQKVAEFRKAVAAKETEDADFEAQYNIRRTQNMTWDEQINGALNHNGKIARSDTLVLDETPNMLMNDGVENRYLAIPLRVITKAKSGKDASHSISDKNLKALQSGVRNAPIVIHNPSRNALVFLTDIKQDGAPVLVSFDKNAVFDKDTVHQATSIHLQMDVRSMLKALPANATIYAKNKNELESAVGVADNLRSLSAQVKFTGDGIAENGPAVNEKDPAKSEASARKTFAAAVADQQVADALMGLYREGDANAEEISAAFEMGYGDFSVEKLRQAVGGKVTETVRKAYEAGRQYRAREDAKRKGGKAPGGKASLYYLAKDGKVAAFRDGKAGRLTVTGKQSVAVKTADFLHRIGIGGNVYFFESYEQKNAEGKTVRVFKDRDGNIKTAPNGIYYSNGDIYIDINAGMDASGITLTTLAHELVHYIQQWSGEKYRALAEFLAEQYEKKGVSAYAAVKATQKRLTGLRGEAVTFAEAYHEWMAESLSTLFNDGKIYDRLLSLKKRDSALYNYLKKSIDRIARLARKHYSTLLAETPEARFVQGLSVEAIEQLQQRLAEALADAGENHQRAAVSEGSGEPALQYNVREDLVDVNGNVYAKVIKPGYVAYNKTRHSNTEYKKYLFSKIFPRKTTIHDGDGGTRVIEFARQGERVNDHPVLGEFTETTDTLKRIATLNFKELLQSSEAQPHKAPDGHQWLDENGWDNRKAYMLDGDTIYPVILHVANAKDGRHLLYDISVLISEGVSLDTKPTSYDAPLARTTENQEADPQLAVKKPTPSGDKVSQSADVVKHQNSDSMEQTASGREGQDTPAQRDAAAAEVQKDTAVVGGGQMQDRGKAVNPYEGKRLYADSEVYDYDFMVALPDMSIAELPPLSTVKDGDKISQNKAIKLGLANANEVGRRYSGDQYAVVNAYTQKEIIIGSNGLGHSLGGSSVSRLRTNARLSSIGGEIVKNAVPINGLKNENRQATGTYAMACLVNAGDYHVVAIVTVEEHTSRVTGIDYVDIAHSINGRTLKKNNEDSRSSTRESGYGSDGAAPATAISNIKIADFLMIVNSTHQSILSHFIVQRIRAFYRAMCPRHLE